MYKRQIEDSILGVPFSISAASFYQVNHAQCEALYRTAAQLAELDGTQKLLDLYCGIGSIGQMCIRDRFYSLTMASTAS